MLYSKRENAVGELKRTVHKIVSIVSEGKWAHSSYELASCNDVAMKSIYLLLKTR